GKNSGDYVQHDLVHGGYKHHHDLGDGKGFVEAHYRSEGQDPHHPDYVVSHHNNANGSGVYSASNGWHEGDYKYAADGNLEQVGARWENHNGDKVVSGQEWYGRDSVSSEEVVRGLDGTVLSVSNNFSEGGDEGDEHYHAYHSTLNFDPNGSGGIVNASY